MSSNLRQLYVALQLPDDSELQLTVKGIFQLPKIDQLVKRVAIRKTDLIN